MRYPSRTDYTQAVRDFPHISMLDPTLKGGMPKRGSDNHLIYDSGNFSIVFPIEAESRTYALRCWIRDVGDVETRYQEISSYLNKSRMFHVPYFVDFEYVPEGILVNGTSYPITRMEWAKGETLRDFIEGNLQNPRLLKTVATTFRKMVATLHTHQISHGDLQDGNILLKPNGADVEIKLIDYDSVFVPSLRGQPDTIIGLPEYQHPQREAGAGDAREKVDYFSELVIYLSFVALAEKPELWGQFGGRTEKGLLFTAEDLRNPDESEVFRELENLSPNVRQLASKLKEFCTKPSIDQLEPLEAVVPIADFLASVWKLFSKNKLATVLAICVVAFFLQMNAKNGAIRQNLKLENQLDSQGTELTSLESKNQELSNENKTLRKQLAKAKLLDGTWYIVKTGDTLYGIGIKHNVSWRSIMSANPKLRSGLPIQSKQKLFIPGPHAIGFKAPLPDPKQVALEAKNAKLLRENLKLEIENIALQKQLDEVTKPDSKQVALDNKNTELRGKNQTLQNENQKLRLKNATLQKQLDRLQRPDTPPVATIPRLTGHTGKIYSVAFSSDSRTLASGSWDNTVRLWDAVTGAHRRTLTGHMNAVLSVVFSPDGRTLASGSFDKTVRLWDGVTGVLRCTLTGHADWVYSVAFSPDGRTLASGSDDTTIRLWDVGTGVHQRTLVGHTGPVRSVAFSSDSRTLASGSWDKTVCLWDGITGTHQRTLAGHKDWVYAVTFSPDGRTLASGSWDHTIRLWDAVTGEHLRTLTGHTAGVYCVAFSPDGRTLASGGLDKTVRLWDSATREHLRTLTGHADAVYSVAFSPDGERLATGSWDETIRLFK